MKAGPSKKRPTESATKTPVPAKKVKLDTPQKTGNISYIFSLFMYFIFGTKIGVHIWHCALLVVNFVIVPEEGIPLFGQGTFHYFSLTATHTKPHPTKENNTLIEVMQDQN